MLNISTKKPTVNKVCLKHNFYVIKQVEPNFSKKEDGYKICKCKKCGKKQKIVIPYNNYMGGDFY